MTGYEWYIKQKIKKIDAIWSYLTTNLKRKQLRVDGYGKISAIIMEQELRTQLARKSV